ncbi:hypothetical protein VC83_00201 [Pseudogymnoascus destructans]|uniref:Roadblock/LAMTOR2 domain-containing protein n=2 Tax=Pseudogymnoascus destructans TaxID=655981 RepID=L8GBW3_PSED2|nr:uncharacterized protein VC83_00201 [Pseudogymnoascus destructans]ELR10552.1 hypothetical protein GMDG_04826 [Pseudogymnoascus destructans 20631-21]OAF62917.1 hypothetical protein VC83_00201 [Pseudogymnoascus destructans]
MAQSLPLGTGSNSSDQFIESLDRLSKKTGVLATIVLDRTSGAILNTSGTLSSIRSTSGSSQSVPAAVPDDASSGLKDQNGVEELARMVWNYMNATKDLVQGLDEQDEVKLLRLRTKKYELVIVPDSKYLLVVIHETPSA